MLMLVTRSHPELRSIVSAAVDGGVNVVQVRGDVDVDVDAICAIVGDRVRVVVNTAPPGPSPRSRGEGAASAADEGRHPAIIAPHAALRLPGLHLPETAPFANASFVGRSVHSVDAAIRAEQEGCDYVVAGSIFPTTSHPNGPVAGLALIEDIAKAVNIPVLAIGGINATNARSCIDAGASGVAVISTIMDADDPKQAAQELWRAIA
ncbi:MAG TPA: thiamine phosphate synthase [Thermoanaerobaculia bacterium]|nr:thiamine phosphate synthase [Thermoanaerobaculia bacterium]